MADATNPVRPPKMTQKERNQLLKQQQREQQQTQQQQGGGNAGDLTPNSPNRRERSGSMRDRDDGVSGKDNGEGGTRGGGGARGPSNAGGKGGGNSGNNQLPASLQSQNTMSSSSSNSYRLSHFDHLPRKQPVSKPHSIEGEGGVGSGLHPATIRLGLLYRKGIISEDDDRVSALLAAFINIIEDYTVPQKKSLRSELDKHISKQVTHLVSCRQLSMGMGNLIRHLKHAISISPPEWSEADAKASLIANLKAFLEERIVLARDAIARYVMSTIRENDVVLTFGSSPLIRHLLLTVAAEKKFHLIVVDSRPLNEGLKTLTASSSKIHCVYTPLSGAAAAMSGTTRVLLGASGLLSNGALFAPAGTAMVKSLILTLILNFIISFIKIKQLT